MPDICSTPPDPTWSLAMPSSLEVGSLKLDVGEKRARMTGGASGFHVIFRADQDEEHWLERVQGCWDAYRQANGH